GYTEDVWNDIYADGARAHRGATPNYQEPKLVLFAEQVASACGNQSSAVGPFYCPGDNQVYIDLEFFAQLATRFGAPGDFAQAYVIAHEVGHHVQNLLGVSRMVHEKKARVSEEEYNQLSVRLELQADYFAGCWAHHAEQRYQILERGDLDEGLKAAFAVGDDTIQKRSRGYVVPESFTHGTSEQRVRWFRLGFKSGDPAANDPFDVDYRDL
ncbi:MAG: zinc metallopeptidase, partial [Planctomycetes bacterium]|nr:zinc metallopeptidase [Planctomycetota bacterium]